MKLIDLRRRLDPEGDRALMSFLGGSLETLLSVSRINELYAGLESVPGGCGVFGAILDRLGVDYSLSDDDLERIPEGGPLVVTANHPFGAVEGLVLGDILTRRRPDARLLGNYLLQHVRELKEFIVPVNPFGDPAARLSNARGLGAAIRHLRAGGALGTFPSGEVAHLGLTRKNTGEPPWSEHVAAVIRHARATVVPMYFPGRNSALFHLLGLLDPRLRTALLPRELLNKRNRSLEVLVGKPVSWERLQQFSDDRERIDYLRLCTLVLGNRAGKTTPVRVGIGLPRRPVAIAGDPETLVRSLEALGSDCLLTQDSEFSVYCLEREQAPEIVREIGRLRELTFRGCGEGTGRALDLDRFDSHYSHLVLWNKTNREVAGSYRLGFADRILERHGPSGLYTSTLFRYGPGFIHSLKGSLELGRSFIRSEYQRQPTALSMLWKGIGAVVVNNPGIRVLFGPVSISRDYHALSRGLMVRFLSENRLDAELSPHVKPRSPYRENSLRARSGLTLCGTPRDAEEVSMLVSEIEADGKGLPVLLRHYLRLNASIVSFNVDRKFSGVVDGLIRVDLCHTDPRILSRFMGRQGYARFMECQELAGADKTVKNQGRE